MKKFLNIILPSGLYKFISIVFHAIKSRSFKYLFYNQEKDLLHNEKILENLNFDKNDISKVLKDNGYDYSNQKLSWHYHIFAGLSLNLKKIKILEIGTHRADTTKYISSIFPSSEIYSCDLDDKDLFKETYGNLVSLGKDEVFKNNFVETRNKNLNKRNIIYSPLNSFNLLDKFEKNFFDIIWLDGDHLNPQVTMDVISCYYLLKKNGVLMHDDIFPDKNDRARYQSDGFEPTEYMDKIKKTKTYYFVKRVRRSNSYIKKHISYSIKL